ncbi:hypothetical protein Poli38472_007761 [Pythium oligandrum]|uniref:FYVE-type domain-containing protein n=1 Tax=Pythium oligandrum TaxID=41045 RepID=A0A8K1CRU1_PYTOL|nr:hypothetical protein Poli38472_007761 [Pythium oligandrum]|eukprot:TMW68089.1 hypothetical protein Poli38472_007761 [Pythium oligandrum]
MASIRSFSTASVSSGTSPGVGSVRSSEGCIAMSTRSGIYAANLNSRYRKELMKAAEKTCNALAQEAEHAFSIPRSRRPTQWRYLVSAHGLSLYQYGNETAAPPQPLIPHGHHVRPSSKTVPRVVALGSIHSTLNELIDLLGPKSGNSTALLNPDLEEDELVDTLADRGSVYTAIKCLRMGGSWNEHMRRQREFLVLESHRMIQTPEGRNGWLIVFHSASWPSCPPPPGHLVRGSMYRSGLLAMESEYFPDRLDLFLATKLDLKGSSTMHVHEMIARDRTVMMAKQVIDAIEQRAAARISIANTVVFEDIQRRVTSDKCDTCFDRIGFVPPGTEPYACRKCCATVCGSCSEIWQRGNKGIRLCMECWADVTLSNT